MIKFGTGGWRSLIGSEFTQSNVQLVTEGIYKLAVEQNKIDKPIVVGYDNRFLSKEAAEWVAQVFAAHGIVVWLMNQSVPTPLIMHMVQKHELYFGIEITASHNPYIYNGIKLFVQEGRDAPIEVTQRLEMLINKIDYYITSMPMDKAIKQGLIKIVNRPFIEFVDHILNVININAIKQSGLKIAFDPMYGSGHYPLNMILNTSQCLVDTIHNQKDAYFGHIAPAPAENTLHQLQSMVIDGEYDIGIALDGDGDRLGIISSSGKYISANQILSMLYWYLHEFKGWKGPVVKNLATTNMLNVIAESFNEKCYEVPVGFKHISHAIDAFDAVLGGESSGGLTVRGHIHGKDSIYAASLFVEMIAVTGMSIDNIVDQLTTKYGSFYMVEENLYLSSSEFERVNKLLNEDPPMFIIPNADSWTYTDGYKESCENESWIICRPSGTEPVLRIFAEAKTETLAREYINKMKQSLNINS
jgi:phosphomannomutase